MSTDASTKHFDVLIVGAGLSGISAGFHLQRDCPDRSFAILEARETLGGTWSLFKYPGIRSDSDMYTLGYSFRPWTNPKAIADGPSILAYVRDTAEAYGLDKKIRYQRRVESVDWVSEARHWALEVRDTATGALERYTCGFLFLCAGYYRYDKGYTPEFAGRERFKGTVIHPQLWPEDFDYSGKKIVVIGSGATAVTLVPALAKKAAEVTMLQRSPTYVLSRPEEDRLANTLRAHLGPETAYAITRWKNVLGGLAFYKMSRRFPVQTKQFLLSLVKREVRDPASVEAHFTPRYNPWDQRVCLVPDGDLFDALKGGNARVVTDTIETFTETGIALSSGAHLDADVIVTATGLIVQFLGGARASVDGKPADLSKLMVYKGMMCSDVPNMAFAVGYTNASWTLKCDLTSEYVCRLLNHMKSHRYDVCVPRQNDPNIREEPLIDFSSGYVQRALDHVPHQGSEAPWKLYQNYILDRFTLRHTRVDDGVMEFR
ncbi:MAG: NAD(P)/FAD-dependent oxidoreductase [Myxococcales bacterium]|nr:NAD(P)/FAD-dependent oxidoreductase [Myxococcales bacterium]